MSGEEPATQIAPVESPQMVSTVKLPILKKGEYTLWSMRMEQYLTNTDYSLWQVILNGDGPIQVTTDENGKYAKFQHSQFLLPDYNLVKPVQNAQDLILTDIQTQTMLVATWTEKAPQVPVKSFEGSCQLSDYDIHYKMMPIFYDNTSAIAISNNPFLHSRTKHIDIKYHFIRDHILKGDIELHFIPTEYQLADIFTKTVDEPTFTRMKAELGMLNID
ncbi:hypothetical protein Tco_0261972 [Tanacetum coccineum]